MTSVARRDVERDDRSRERRFDTVFHLHRFEDDEEGTRAAKTSPRPARRRSRFCPASARARRRAVRGVAVRRDALGGGGVPNVKPSPSKSRRPADADAPAASGSPARGDGAGTAPARPRSRSMSLAHAVALERERNAAARTRQPQPRVPPARRPRASSAAPELARGSSRSPSAPARSAR